jgi:hypothetical protein
MPTGWQAGDGWCARNDGARQSEAEGTPAKPKNELPGTISSAAWCYEERRKR